jgi:predicted DNA binding CopG/RHH family protein
MAGISLSYCQLIKIILSQIGGNPLQQKYTTFTQGARQVAVGLGIPGGFTEIRNLIDTITKTITDASVDLTNAQKIIEAAQQQLFQNPIAFPAYATNTAITLRITPINSRIATIDQYTANADSVPGFTVTSPYTSAAAEKSDLATQRVALYSTSDKLATFKSYTDRLSGVATLSGAEAAGGCSLQDLLGNGCTPNDSVPDIDLKALIASLNQGDLIKALEQKLLSGLGTNELITALGDFNTVITRFNSLFDISINKAALRAAIEAQINHIIFNLLSGCSGGVYEKTLKEDVATIISSAVASWQQTNDGLAFVDQNTGNIIAKATTTSSAITGATDSRSTQNPNANLPVTIAYEVTIKRPGNAPYTLTVEAADGKTAAKTVERNLIIAGANSSGYTIQVVNAQLGADSYTITNNGPTNVGTIS